MNKWLIVLVFLVACAEPIKVQQDQSSNDNRKAAFLLDCQKNQQPHSLGSYLRDTYLSCSEAFEALILKQEINIGTWERWPVDFSLFSHFVSLRKVKMKGESSDFLDPLPELPASILDLDLSGGKIGTVPSLASWTSLRSLNLSFNEIRKIDLAEIPANIKTLDLSYNLLEQEDLSLFQDQVLPKSFELRSNLLTDYRPWRRLSQKQNLHTTKLELKENIEACRAGEYSIDLYHLFLPSSQQASIGACHAHGAAHLYEASYFSHFRERVDFSAQELFIQTLLHDRRLFSVLAPQTNDFDGDGDLELEAFTIYDTLNIVRSRGFCREQTVPSRKIKENLKLSEDIGKWLEQSLEGKNINARIEFALSYFREEIIEIIKQSSFAPALALCHAREEKEYYLNKIKNFRLELVNYPKVYFNIKLKELIKQKLLSRLCLGQALLVGMQAYNSWHRLPQGLGDGHALVIVGYDVDKKEFLVQNSWGEGGNYPIPEDEIWRIDSMYWLQ